MKKIAVWFSCGAASAVAAKKTIEKYKNEYEITVINNPVIEEHEDNQRFLKDVEKWIGQEIIIFKNPKFPQASAKVVWEKRRFMSGPKGAPCTMELKKRARQIWEEINKPDYHVLGFTYDEIKRHERFIKTEKENLLPVLIDLKLTKNDCFKIIQEAKIELPQIYKLGFPNANCIGCVKAGSATYWNLVREKFPEIFQDRLLQSRKIGSRLVNYKGKRIFLDELPVGARGRDLKNYSFDCGIFCEENYE